MDDHAPIRVWTLATRGHKEEANWKGRNYCMSFSKDKKNRSRSLFCFEGPIA